MSKHYSANQFESAYVPVRLCNWEVPKCHRTNPLVRKGSTKFVSNDRGHLLPDIQRPKTSPWGDYRNTWQLPKRITGEEAKRLSSTKKSVHATKIDSSKELQSDRFVVLNTEPESNRDSPYTPGDLTQAHQHHPSRSILAKSPEIHLPELNNLYVEKEKPDTDNNNLTRHQTPPNEFTYKTSAAGVSCRSINLVDKIKTPPNSGADEKTQRSERTMRYELVSEKPGENNTVPIIPAYCNFEAARRMAAENLEHQPLPDSIMDRTYLKMQALGMANPELSLNVEPTATGVGVKTHNAGPTHCTKLKVFRPKTCGIVPPPFDDPHPSGIRPQTSGVPYRKARIEPMDLAICWDYRPTNPLDEPKEPPHIDGSNDTVAPAIFNVVKTPRQTPSAAISNRSAGVFAHTAGEDGFFDKDIMLRSKSYFSSQLEKNTDRACKCSMEGGSRSHSAVRSNSQMKALNERYQSSPNLSVQAEASDIWTPHESIIVCNYNKEHYHYRPNPKASNTAPMKNSVKPVARLCQQNAAQTNPKCRKHEAKCSHHAGKRVESLCSSLENASKSSSGTGSEFTSKVIRIPKPRHPYAKKNYTINTLAPPFACWKGGAGQGGYPEHWRLASVYQHAYKPPEQRKRPLLATVYQ